jgi:hypothetical protein
VLRERGGDGVQQRLRSGGDVLVFGGQARCPVQLDPPPGREAGVDRRPEVLEQIALVHQRARNRPLMSPKESAPVIES